MARQRPPTSPARDLRGALHSPLDRLLTIFSDVEPGEGVTGAAMLGAVFLLLTSIYLLKPARDGLLSISFISGAPGLSDMELKAYSSFGQSLLLLGVVPVYARFARRLDRSSLARGLTLFFVSNLLLFWFLQSGIVIARVPFLGIVFYLWFGVFNLLAIVQFWSFAADFYSEHDGRRLFPAIAVGATAGSAFGAWLAKTLIRSGLLTTYSLLLAASLALLGSLALLVFAESRSATARGARPALLSETGTGLGAFRLVLSQRFLLATAIVVLVANWVKTNSDNLLFAIVQEVIGSEANARGLIDAASLDRFTADQTTAFYGGLFFWVNVAALILQSLFASRILKYGGFGALFLALPFFSVVAYPALAMTPVLGLFRVVKVIEDATTYSLYNTGTQVLWLPTTREMKYSGKAAIDTFFVRVGDALAALTTFVGIQLLTLPAREFFALNAILALGWIGAGLVVVNEHRKLEASSQAAADEGAADAPRRATSRAMR
jgi:ATP:ADP antiporter, AAA family